MINSSAIASLTMRCALTMPCGLIMLPSVANWVGYRLPNYRTNALFSERSEPISDRREHN
jgi:hypothetical protein